MDIHREFDRQVATFFDKGYAKLANFLKILSEANLNPFKRKITLKY